LLNPPIDQLDAETAATVVEILRAACDLDSANRMLRAELPVQGDLGERFGWPSGWPRSSRLTR
jgi:hypothetical protein